MTLIPYDCIIELLLPHIPEFSKADRQRFILSLSFSNVSASNYNNNNNNNNNNYIYLLKTKKKQFIS